MGVGTHSCGSEISDLFVLVVVVQSVRKSCDMIVKMHQVTLPLQSAKAVQKKLTPLHSTAQLSFQSYTGSSVLPQGLAVREVLTWAGNDRDDHLHGDGVGKLGHGFGAS